MRKIGFACKISEIHPTKGVISIPEYNVRGTTITWLNRQKRDVAEQKLWEIVEYNISAVLKSVQWISKLPEHLRMFRIGSDVLPAFTESTWSYFYKQPVIRAYCERHFARIGEVAREHGVRLSFHPGQFCVLASDNPDIVNNSIEEFEYHATMAAWMGFGRDFQDFKINVHIAGRAGPEGIRRAYGRLSPEARNCITIENEEMSYGLDDCLGIGDLVPIVLDIHHHWVREGEYISSTDDRIKRVIDSWRGVRPTMHYSVSREDVLIDHSVTALPDHKILLECGHKKQKLRAHSDYMWNEAVNHWAGSHSEWADIMVESKAKNLASFKFAESLSK